MSWYPKATKKAVGEQVDSTGFLEIEKRIGASTAISIVDEFEAFGSPHFYVRTTGAVAQHRSDLGTPTIVIATQGPAGKLTAKQAAAIQALCEWLDQHHDHGPVEPEPTVPATVIPNAALASEALPLCWLHGPDGCDDCELRWSMRAITAHLEHSAVWIVGYAPPWVDRSRVQVIDVPTTGNPHGFGKHHQLNAALAAACAAIPGRFVVCHDDHFPVAPDASIDPVYRGGASLVSETEALEKKHARSAWTKNHRATLDHLVSLGRDADSLASYEVHRPMVVDSAPLAAMLAAVPVFPVKAVLYKSLYGNLAEVGGVGVYDHKVKAEDSEISTGSDWVSTNESSFAGLVGHQLRETFATPSAYERADSPPKVFPDPVVLTGTVEALEPTTVPGAKTAQVARMQGWLNVLGYACGQPPGHYGRKTQIAVKAFQEANGCKCGGQIKSEKFALLQRLAAAAVAAGEVKIVHPHQAHGLSSRQAGAALHDLAYNVPPDEAIVELGVFQGRTLLYLARGSSEGNRAPVTGVDPWDLPGDRYPSAWRAEKRHRSTFTHAETRAAAEGNVARSPWSDLVTLQRAFSVDAGNEWAGPAVGLLHIDGNHEAPHPLEDFDAWSPHLAPGAVVVWDDWDDEHPGVQEAVTDLVARGVLEQPVSAPGCARLAVTRFLGSSAQAA